MVGSFNPFRTVTTQLQNFCLRAPPSGFGLLMTCDQTLSRYSWLTAAKPVDDGISVRGHKSECLRRRYYYQNIVELLDCGCQRQSNLKN